MKMRKILATLAAAVVACSALVVSASAADEKAYYQFGGESVNWAVDIDEDGNEDTGKGVGTDTWVGTLGEDGSGTITIPVAKGDTVEIVCLSWTGEGNEAYVDHVMFTAAVGDNKQDVTPNKSAKFEVTDDVTELKVDITWGELVGDDGCAYNAWCGNGVIVTKGAAAGGEESKTDSTTESKDDGAKNNADDSNKPTGATAGLALAGLALAGVAVVATKKSK